MFACPLSRFTRISACLLGLLVAPASHAILIEYEALDLVNTTPGTDLWQYSYYVSDHDFLTDQGFSIWFHSNVYNNLTLASTSPVWNAIAVQPDILLPDAGYYDALAQVDHASLASPFSVQFSWLGNGVPGSQRFDLYNLSNGNLVVTHSGDTVLRGSVVPLPGSLWLLLSGMATVSWWVRRRDGRALRS